MKRRRKQITLTDGYIEDGCYDSHDPAISRLCPGDVVCLAEVVNLNTGAKKWRWTHDLSGIPGNMDPSIRRRHGWRGTTNEWHIEAIGCWRVRRIEEAARGIRVVFSEVFDDEADSIMEGAQ